MIYKLNPKASAISFPKRLRTDYVNNSLLLIYQAVLQNIQFEGIAGDDVINYISKLVELRRFFSEVNFAFNS